MVWSTLLRRTDAQICASFLYVFDLQCILRVPQLRLDRRKSRRTAAWFTLRDAYESISDLPTNILSVVLQPGQELGDHQVKEAALLVVVDGRVRIEAGDESIDAGVGTVFRFEPDERHSVAADGEARVLLVLAPWPGEGHYRGERALEASAAKPPTPGG